MSDILNIAATLRETAGRFPAQPAVICPGGRDRFGRTAKPITFAELDRESDSLAFGLRALGVGMGQRLVLMVRPGVEFIALTYALFKVGAVVVLIDPGMGPRRVFRCLDQVEPEGFVAIPPVPMSLPAPPAIASISDVISRTSSMNFAWSLNTRGSSE